MPHHPQPFKTARLYQIRYGRGTEHTKTLGRQLVNRTRAERLLRRLKRQGLFVYMTPHFVTDRIEQVARWRSLTRSRNT